ncbi:MAG: hypothetical protein J6E42_03040, partial [Firmicutes bacterium]|nr:hypothetical protein [Bacillota bacterium]
ERSRGRDLLRKGTALLAAMATICSTALLMPGNVSFGATSSSQAAAASLMASLGVISAGSSGSYNLEQNVTRKQFVKMLVDVSPYSDEVMTGIYSAPFRGVFPYAQMNLYQSTGLSSGMGISSASDVLTRGDAVQLLYNLMKTNIKDGSKKYAETLGYSLNASGEIDYASVVNDNMYGPYTVDSAASWASELGVDKNTVMVYKNGSRISADAVAAYDVLYYTANKDTIYAYSDKVTGIYEKATPSQNNLTSVMVSGKTYAVESTAAFAALSSGGTVKIYVRSTSSSDYRLGTVSDVMDAVSDSSDTRTFRFYQDFDKTAATGSRIRVITIG